MKKIFSLFVKDLKTNLICLISSLLGGLLVFLLYFFINGPQNLFGSCNASLITAAFTLIPFAIFILNYFGTFDLMIFGFYSFGWMFSPSKRERKYKDLYSYNLAKKEKRNNSAKIFVPFGMSFTFYLAVAIILEIIYLTTK